MKQINIDTPLTGLSFTVIDTETTGMVNEEAQIIELAAVRIKNHLHLDLHCYFNTLINVSVPIHPRATMIHGITNNMLTTQPKLNEVFPKFVEFVGDTIPIYHNASFDTYFIDKAQVECNNFINGQYIGTSPLVLDTLKISRKVTPQMRKHGLDHLIPYYQIESPRLGGARHRALFDADHTAILFLKLMEKLTERQIYTIGDLIMFLNN